MRNLLEMRRVNAWKIIFLKLKFFGAFEDVLTNLDTFEIKRVKKVPLTQFWCVASLVRAGFNRLTTKVPVIIILN